MAELLHYSTATPLNCPSHCCSALDARVPAFLDFFSPWGMVSSRPHTRLRTWSPRRPRPACASACACAAPRTPLGTPPVHPYYQQGKKMSRRKGLSVGASLRPHLARGRQTARGPMRSGSREQRGGSGARRTCAPGVPLVCVGSWSRLRPPPTAPAGSSRCCIPPHEYCTQLAPPVSRACSSSFLPSLPLLPPSKMPYSLCPTIPFLPCAAVQPVHNHAGIHGTARRRSPALHRPHPCRIPRRCTAGHPSPEAWASTQGRGCLRCTWSQERECQWCTCSQGRGCQRCP